MMIKEAFELLKKESLVYPLKSRDEITHIEAVERLYTAFSKYRVCMPPCDRCFSDVIGLYRRFAEIKDIRKASASEIACLYWESPYCGGSSNWKRFFPVMLLNGLWDHGGCDLLDRAVGAGMWAWPESEQTAVRDVVVSAFLDWSTDRISSPLGYDPTYSNPRNRRKTNRLYVREDDIGTHLITAVLLCRIDPTTIFSYLLKVNSNKTRMLLARLIDGCLDFWGWGVISNEDNDLTQYAAGCCLLAQQTVSEEILIKWFTESTEKKISNYLSAIIERHYFSDMHKDQTIGKPCYDVFKDAFEISQTCTI